MGSGVALNESPSLIGQMKCPSLGFPSAQENSALEMQCECLPTAHALPREHCQGQENDRVFQPGSPTSAVGIGPLSSGHKLFPFEFSKHLLTPMNSARVLEPNKRCTYMTLILFHHKILNFILVRIK